MNRIVGKVVHIVRDRGFFFLKPDNQTTEYFVHMTEMKGFHFNDVREGMEFEFLPVPVTPRGPRAQEVSRKLPF